MNDPLNQTDQAEQAILVDGIPVPLSMAGAAVKRCITAIQIVNKLLDQGFASKDDLKNLKAGLTGEIADEAKAEGVIE